MTDPTQPTVRIRLTAVNGAHYWIMRVGDRFEEYRDGKSAWNRCMSVTNLPEQAGRWPVEEAEAVARDAKGVWGEVEVLV